MLACSSYTKQATIEQFTNQALQIFDSSIYMFLLDTAIQFLNNINNYHEKKVFHLLFF
jgi:hypothetical protein